MFNREYIFNKVHFPASYVRILVGNPVMKSCGFLVNGDTLTGADPVVGDPL